MKTYRRHNCERQHRTYKKFAECAFPRAAWVLGEGPYAIVAWCGTPTVTLWPTAEEALNAMATGIDKTGCGHLCSRKHEVILLER